MKRTINYSFEGTRKLSMSYNNVKEVESCKRQKDLVDVHVKITPNHIGSIEEMTNEKKVELKLEKIPSSTECEIIFILKNNTEKKVTGEVGKSLLNIAHSFGIDIEGACDSSLACSTCHVILDEVSFNKIPEATEREEDLLDLAPHLEDTSRLSCQITVTSDLNGMKVKLPKSTLNFYVDGHVASHH